MHVIGTAGHVDHGKSTLVERLTGMDPDRFAEEKRRGLTIDLGFAWLTLPSGNEVGIIDVPGHERFVRNMLAGAGGTTICLFVVAANEGWKPQSAEHLAILDVLGTTEGVVALTKCDLVDPDTLDSIRDDIAGRLSSSSLSGMPIVACSATTGEGIDELVAELDRVVTQAPAAVDLGRPRLWVDRVFTICGAGTVVTGTLGGGALTVGDDIVIAPEGRHARVRSIQSHKKDVSHVEPGNRTALNLAGLERQGAQRGDAVVTGGEWHPTRRVHASVRVLDPSLAGQVHELKEKGAHLLYAGTAETPVRVRLIGTDRLEPGAAGYAQLELRDPLPLARGDRFVLRDVGRVLTLGGGRVLDPAPTRGPRATDLGGYLDTIAASTPEETLRALVEAEGALDLNEALLRSGASVAGPDATVLGKTVVSRARLGQWSTELKKAVAQHHVDEPLQKGIDREELRATLKIHDKALFDALVDSIGDVTGEGPLIRMVDHAVALAPEQQAARSDLFTLLESNGLNPPLAKELHVAPALLRSLVDAGEIVSVGDFYLTARQTQDVIARVTAFIRQHGSATVAQLRDELQTSRKYAVPLCEWLDQRGVTRRQGNDRVLGPRAPD